MVKKAHLVTGKGGVGKSLISGVLAHYLSLQNQQIILTELTEQSFFKDFLNLPEINYKPSPWLPHISVCQWSPEDCLKEYALHLIKIESLYKLFFENPLSKSLIQVAPGLYELAILGKITSSPRHHGPKMIGDQLVIDSYSTGHFLSLLRAPHAMAEAIKFGPMGEQSRGIDKWLRNPDFTEVHLVTLAEELPVTETIELALQLQSEFGIQSKIYLNKLLQLTPADLEKIPPAASDIFYPVAEQEKLFAHQLQKTGLPVFQLPLVTSTEVLPIIRSLSTALTQQKQHEIRA